MLGKIKAWFKNSVTILWARLQVFAGLAVAALVSLSSDPIIQDAVRSALQAKYIPYYVIALGLLTELARRRTVERE